MFFTPHTVNNGKQILLAGGARSVPAWPEHDDFPNGNSKGADKVLSDVFMFDVETSVWTKVSATPVGYYSSACAISGDSLILYGGFKESYRHGNVKNDNVPSIYDIKKNRWVSTYIPQ